MQHDASESLQGTCAVERGIMRSKAAPFVVFLRAVLCLAGCPAEAVKVIVAGRTLQVRRQQSDMHIFYIHVVHCLLRDVVASRPHSELKFLCSAEGLSAETLG